MSHTYSHLIFEAILPNLQPAQIDELRSCNPYLNKYIGRNRLDLPGTPFEQAVIWPKEVFLSNSNFHEFGYDPLLRIGEGMMKYLENVSPKILTMETGKISEFIDRKWIRRIKKVRLKYCMNKDEFSEFVKLLDCTCFQISKSPEANLDEILDQMHHVEEFEVQNARMPLFFMYKLVQKSKIGPGIRAFFWNNTGAEPFDAEELLYFIENASFSTSAQYTNATIQIDHVSGKREDFIKQLKTTEDVSEEIVSNGATFIDLIHQSVKVSIYILNFVNS